MNGVILFVCSRTSSAVPTMPSSPAWLVARVRLMKFVRPPGLDVQRVVGLERVRATVPLPPLATRSRPWSKNWPKIVNQELNGADRPSSGDDVRDEDPIRRFRVGVVVPLLRVEPAGERLLHRRDGGRVRHRLVDDQVADRPRIGVVT